MPKIQDVPIRSAMFDGGSTDEGTALVKKLGNLDSVWVGFFGRILASVGQGTHAERLAASPAGAGPYFESDRNAIYQPRIVNGVPVWVFVVGQMTGLMANRPRDLGPNDAGFLFTSSDGLDYRWNGTAWGPLDTVKGGPALTTVGAIPKVTAAGTLGESALSDDGTTVSSTEPVEIDSGATPDSQLALKANGLGALAFLCYVAGNQQILFGAEYLGGVFIARDTSAARILRATNKLRFGWATGLTPGSSFTFTDAGAIDLDNGLWGFGGNITPGYPVDVTGNCNVSGVYRVAGTQVVGARGAALTAAIAAVGAAPAAYNQAYVQTLADAANNLKTRLDQMEARLTPAAGHGLFG
jgi:hypothetical protein